MSNTAITSPLAGLPAEVLGMIMDNVTIVRDLKSLTEVSKGLRAVALPRLWSSIDIRPRGGPECRHVLHDLRLICPSQPSLRLTKHLRFKADFDFHSFHRCPHFSEDNFTDSYHELDSLDGSVSSGDTSLGSTKDALPRPGWFDQLAHTAEMILDMFADNQLTSFSWDMGTCVPEGILGPRGVINLRQASLESVSLTTDWQCHRDDSFWHESDCGQQSVISLHGLMNLKRLRWRAPHEENIYALSCVINSNKQHLEVLELDLIDWSSSIGRQFRYGETAAVDCQLLSHLFLPSPSPAEPLFPNLQELSLSECAIGPDLTLSVNFEVLRSLRLRGCPGWRGFLGRIVAMRIALRIKSFELLVPRDNSMGTAGQGQIVARFLGSFSRLEELYLLIAPPWFPKPDFWTAVAAHQRTLRRCIMDGLWEQAPSHRRLEVPHLNQSGGCLPFDPLGVLDLECVGLIQEPGCLRAMLQPFASKSCLKVIHVRQGYVLPWRDQVWVWEKSVAPDHHNEEQGPDARVTDPGALLRKVMFPHYCSEKEIFRLQEDFCCLVEWAFGPEGIRSLQTIAIGDYSPAFDQLESQIFIQRDLREGIVIVERDSDRWIYAFEEHKLFLQSCPKIRLL